MSDSERHMEKMSRVLDSHVQALLLLCIHSRTQPLLKAPREGTWSCLPFLPVF